MTEPTYLPLLNSIAVNECKGDALLSAWAAATADAELAATLRFVAIREREHAAAFTKRICELGHAVCEDTAYQVFKDFDALLAFMGSDAPDADKVARFGGTGGDGKDPFRGFFNDTNIDPQTGALLGRYIAEERDSGRRLQAHYQRICEQAAAPAEAAAEAATAGIDELRASIDALQSQIDALKRMRSVA
ncbi:MAG: hypothetical protein ACNA7W_11580 [Pseudomonadales bacterium]